MAVVASVAVNLDSRGVPAKLKQIADRGKEVDRSLNGAAAATTKAGREIKTAANGMRYFTDAAGRARKVNGQFVTTAEAAAAGIKNQGDAASQAAGGFNKLIRGLAGAAAGFATVGTAAALAGRAIQSAIGRTESERRLQILASSYGEVAQIQNAAATSAKLFGQSQTETNQSIATAYARLRPLGISLDEISSTYNGFNTAARLSGSTAQETSAAFTQLAQALGSGVLRGDEFNSIAEQAPGLLQAISKELNVSVGRLRDYAKDGKITSDVVINALKAIESEGAAPLAEALSGPEQKLKDLQNETDNLNAEIGKLALPALITVVGELTDVIRTASENTKVFSQVMNGLRQEFDFILTPLGSFYEFIGGIPGIMTTAVDSLFSMLGPLRQVAQLIGFISGETLGPALQRAQAIGSYTGMADAPEDVRRALNPPARPTIPTIPTGGGAAARGAGAAAAKDAQRAADAAAREAEQRRINLRNQDQLIERLRAQVVLQNSFTDGDRIMNQLLLDQLEIRQDIQNRMEGASDAMKQLLIEEADLRSRLAMDKGAEPFVRAGMNMGESLAEGIGKAKEETDLLNQALAGAGEIIGNQLRGAIDGLIDGTADWNKILRDTLSQLGSFFLNFGLNALAGPAGSGGILSFLGFGARANGGPVNANEPYIVGERGPELFMPSSSGMVMSNENLQAQNRAFLDSIDTENGGTASDDSEAEREATVATRAAIRESERIQENRTQIMTQQMETENSGTASDDSEAEREATVATRAAIRESERIQENRMQIMSQQKEFDRRYERERIEQMASTPGRLNIKYESQVINNVEYVTRDQAERMAAQSALRGRELAIGALQNSVKTRKRVGI